MVTFCSGKNATRPGYGGPFRGHPEVHNGVDSLLPVDLYIPDYPPHPLTVLDGLLRFLRKS